MYRPASLMRLVLPELTPETFALEAAAGILNDSASVGEFVLRERNEIRDQGLTGLAAAARYSDVIDASLRRILALARASVGASVMDEAGSGVAIVATGGYGRRELAPFSDIDVTFIPLREDDPGIDALVRSLFQTMMDALTRTAGLKVGYAYRVVDDLGSLELQTQTSLVDSRFVAGDYELFADFKQALRRQINPAHFIFNKDWERRVARASAGGTIYGVEPDLKNGPGGLREIHTATWMAQVRFGIWSPAVWEELVDRDVVTFRQVERMYEAVEFLHTVRNALHWRAGKQNDLLLMAQQADIAEGLGYRTTEALTPSQQLMAAYFGHAEQINRISQRVIHWVLDSRLDLGSGLGCVRRRIECTSLEHFLSRPSHLIQAFLSGQSLGIGFSPDLETLIRGAIEGPQALQPDRDCGPLLLRVLEAPERVTETLTLMAQTGVLGWVMPEFAPLMTLAPRNSAHEYTVGYHSLEVVRRLEEMREESSDSLFREVFSHLDYPATIFLAALLHDSGRALAGSGHAAQGAAQTPAVCIRLDMEPQQARKAQFLVAQHLLMSEISRFRDINQDSSVRELINVTVDQDLLDHLFLLTYADSASVGRNAWSPLQGRFLQDLYHRATQMLARPESDIGEIDLPRYQRKVARALTAHNLDPELVARHVDLMPAPYLLNTPPQMMALHIEMVEKLRVLGKPVVEFRDDRDGQFTELIICAYDDPLPGLLSKVAGCLWAHDISVHAAQVFTREAAPRIALDTLWVDVHGHTLDPYAKRRLEMDLGPVLAGDLPVQDLLRRSGKGDGLEAPLHEPEVAAHRTDGHTICEVRVGNQRGLLYRLTRAISELGWNIGSARINSDDTRARDVFYVAGLAGISTEDAAARLRERLVTTHHPADNGTVRE